MNAPPQTQDFLDVDEPETDDLTLVRASVIEQWRHGVLLDEVYHRPSDDTFWQVRYRRSTDGECNGLRDNEHTVKRVVPQQVTVTSYVDPPEHTAEPGEHFVCAVPAVIVEATP